MAATTTTTTQGWRNDVVSSFDPDDKLSESLLIQCATWAGFVDGDTPSVLVPYVSADPAAAIVAENATIPTSDGAYSQVKINTDKVAVVTRMSNELTSHPKAAERIANSVRRAIIAKADALFMANASDPTGLLNTAGLDTAGDLGGATDPNLFAVYDAVAAIEDDGGTATHLLINPLDWATLSKLPEGTGSNRSLLADVHDVSRRSLAGVPVIVHSAVTQGTALMLDKSEVVGAWGNLELARSEHAFFTDDAIAIRATWRIGWQIVRPARLQKLTIAAA